MTDYDFGYNLAKLTTPPIVIGFVLAAYMRLSSNKEKSPDSFWDRFWGMWLGLTGLYAVWLLFAWGVLGWKIWPQS